MENGHQKSFVQNVPLYYLLVCLVVLIFFRRLFQLLDSWNSYETYN